MVEQDDVVLGAEKREMRLAVAVAELSKWAMGLGWWWLLCAGSVGEAMEV